MNALLNRLCRKATLPASVATALLLPPAPAAADPVPPTAPDAIAEPDTAAEPVTGPAEAAGCGWFDSSLDLRQGLAVSEMRAPDWTVMLLWFGPAAVRASAHLQ